MLASDIIEQITSSGGRIWLEENKVLAHLPEALRPLVSVLLSHKPELMAELTRRPAMPAGVRLVSWSPRKAPVGLPQGSTVTDVDLFISTTRVQLEARLKRNGFLDGGWRLVGLLSRLAAVGCHIALDNPKKSLQ